MDSKFFKGLFIQEEPQVVPAVTKVEVPTIKATDVTVMPIDTSKTKALLRDALEQESSTGFDYIKFKKSLDSMKQFIPDERIRYISSFMAAKTLGLSKDNLLNTADKSLKTLEKEALKFNDMITTKIQETIGSNQGSLKNIEDTITQRTKEHQRLTEEIASLHNRKKEIEFQMNKDQEKIESLKREFNLSYQELVSDVKMDIDKITTYLEA